MAQKKAKKTANSKPGTKYLVLNPAITPSSGKVYEEGELLAEGRELTPDDVEIYLAGGDIVEVEDTGFEEVSD